MTYRARHGLGILVGVLLMALGSSAGAEEVYVQGRLYSPNGDPMTGTKTALLQIVDAAAWIGAVEYADSIRIGKAVAILLREFAEGAVGIRVRRIIVWQRGIIVHVVET